MPERKSAPHPFLPNFRGLYEGPPLSGQGTETVRDGLAIGGTTYINYESTFPDYVRLIEGTVPIAGDARDRLISLLREIMQRPEEDEYVMAAARSLLWQHFRIDRPPVR